MIDALIQGKIYGQPVQRTAKTGKPFAVAKVRVSAGDGEGVFVSVIAFDAAPCAALLALGEGDAVSMAGTLTPKVWTDKAGATHPALDIVAHQVLTPYHVTRKRRAVQGGDGSDTAPTGRTGHGSAPRQGNAPSGRAFDQWQAAQLPAGDFADMEGDVL